jgi:LacI family transcriptional regulator
MAKKQFRIGIYVHPWHSYGRDVLCGIAAYGHSRPDWDLYAPWPSRPDWARLPNRSLDGLILRVGGRNDPPADLGHPLPRVLIGTAGEARQPLDLLWDDHAIGRMAGQHLLEQGHRTIAFLGDPNVTYQYERGEGLSEELRANGLVMQKLSASQNEASNLSVCLASLPQPAAIFAATDPLGLDVLHAAHDIDRSVPEDLAVVAAGDDDVYSELSDPPLSSVVLPGDDVGRLAAERLAAILDGRDSRPGPLRVPPRCLSVRRSSETLAIDDRHVAEALRYIRERAHEGITVADVHRASSLSRRALEMRFKRALGRTLREELRGARIARSKRLLSETLLPMQKVASLAGFPDPHQFSAIFTRETGQTPTQYRRSKYGSNVAGGSESGAP